MTNDLFTVSEVADMLRVDYTTVRRWIRQGTLEAVVLPRGNARRRNYRIRRATLDALLK
ncbi:MAG TPA: helix-turn-helix domain-containing protein [Ktedonobacteraceae bacterium]|nr:helix-turn-helix domain-containing protein [Ktedonobacteraceae bacterium]